MQRYKVGMVTGESDLVELIAQLNEIGKIKAADFAGYDPPYKWETSSF